MLLFLVALSGGDAFISGSVLTFFFRDKTRAQLTG
jgi:hypothetical protein